MRQIDVVEIAMKLKVIIFTNLILLMGIQFCFSQDTQLKLLESVFPANCEFAQLGTINLMRELENNPNSIGYIVINQRRLKSKEFNMWGFYHEDIISLEIKRQKKNLGPDRLRIIRAESDKYKIDFYIAADKTIKPNLPEAKWDLTIPSKPIMFDNGMGGQLCQETPFRLSIFAELLAAYPKAQGHFVIYADSIKDFSKYKKEIIGVINKVGIPLNRFRFLFRRDDSTINGYARLWLVPNNTK